MKNMVAVHNICGDIVGFYNPTKSGFTTYISVGIAGLTFKTPQRAIQYIWKSARFR